MNVRGEIYGAVTVGKRGQVVIPTKLRKPFNIKPGDRMMVFAEPDKNIISLIPEEYFNKSLKKNRTLVHKLKISRIKIKNNL